MEVRNTSIQQNNINYPVNKNISGNNSVENTQAESQVYASGANNDSSAVNSAIKAAALPGVSTGYKEIQTFDVPFYNKGKIYQLDNGQKVLIIPKSGSMALNTFVRVGSFNEPDRIRGISHYIEHNLFNGSKNLKPGEFVEKVNGMGAIYNAGTNNNQTNYFISSPIQKYEDFEKFMSIHADMLQNPSFLEEQLEKEKGPVISEIHMYDDEPGNIVMNLMMKNLFNIKSESKDLVAGSENNIKNLTRQDVLDYYNKWYTPDNMTTVIVGDVNPDQAIKTVSKYFNKKSQPKNIGEFLNKTDKKYENLDNVTQTTKRVDITSSHTESTSVGLMFVGPKNNSIKELFAADAFGYALAGHENARLTKALKSFNTSASGGLSTISSDYNAHQVINVSADFKPGDEENGLKTIYSVLHEMTYRPLTETELKIVKGKLKNSFMDASEHPMAIANYVGNSITNSGSIDSYTKHLEIIDSLTSEDIMNIARKYIDLNRASIGVIHPEGVPVTKSADNRPVSTKPAGVAALSFKGATPYKSKNVAEYNLANNMHAVINDDPFAIKPVANIAFDLRSNQNLKPGLVEVLTRMLDAGSRFHTKEQLAEILDLNNISFALYAHPSGIEAYVRSNNENFPKALDIFKEVLNNPNFTEENFKKAKEDFRLELLSEPKSAFDKGLEKLNEDMGVSFSNETLLKNLDNLTLKDITDFYNYTLHNSRGLTVVTASTGKNPQLNNAIFNSLQTDMPVVKPYRFEYKKSGLIPEKNTVITQIEDKNQADIVQMYKVAENGNIKDRAAVVLLCEILGGNSSSKLFMDLRENQKLAYRVGSGFRTDGANGYIALDIKTTTKREFDGRIVPEYQNVQKSLDGFKKNINELINQPVSTETLEAAKTAIKNTVILRNESASGRNQDLKGGYLTPYGSGFQEELFKAIDQMTPEDIQKAANLYLNKPSVTSIVASKDTLDNVNQYLASIGDIKEYQ